ncbi:MAG: aminotransferase, partial [Spirochaetales bacterium]|nr:aminotransferase [Candidatus Physcosoma equi]
HQENWAYIQENFRFLQHYLETYLPQCRLIKPEATYLAWVDCSGLGFNGKELEAFIKDKAKLWLDTGRIFGKESECFMRFVLACPRRTLAEALDRLRKAVEGR